MTDWEAGRIKNAVDDLTHSVSRIQKSLDEIAVKNKSGDHDGKIAAELAKIPGKLTFPVSITEYYRRENDPPWRTRVAKGFKAVLEIVAVLVASYLAFLNWEVLQTDQATNPPNHQECQGRR